MGQAGYRLCISGSRGGLFQQVFYFQSALKYAMAIWKRPKPPFWERARKQVAQHRITEHDLMPGLRVLERIKRLDRAERARAIAFLQRNGMPRGFSFDALSNNALKFSAN